MDWILGDLWYSSNKCNATPLLRSVYSYNFYICPPSTHHLVQLDIFGERCGTPVTCATYIIEVVNKVSPDL